MTKLQKIRWLESRLPSPDAKRIVILTGARQTGKTTLARKHYYDLRYVNLDAIEDREAVRTIQTANWAREVGIAVLDEAQKEPVVFDKVKWAFDEGQIGFTVILGSSRILLLEKVKESLAGRAFIYDLWPLMASELRYEAGMTPQKPLLHDLLGTADSIDDVLVEQPQVLLGEEEAERVGAIEHLARWGGMPGLLPFSDRERREWLRSYQQTYLERDLADLVRLRDLFPFRSLQQLAMLRSGQLLSYSGLARDAGIAVTTVRNYLEYLRISYQTLLIQPWATNLTSVVVKAPKLYWMDLGLLRQGTSRWGPLDGAMFETLAVGEIHKWVNTMAEDTQLYFYRTRSGMEVDLLLKTPRGLVGVEIKNRETVVPADSRSLKALANSLDSQWLGGIVIYRGKTVENVYPEASIWAVPLHRLV